MPGAGKSSAKRSAFTRGGTEGTETGKSSAERNRIKTTYQLRSVRRNRGHRWRRSAYIMMPTDQRNVATLCVRSEAGKRAEGATEEAPGALK
jgi:hypothetical protein